MWKRLLPLTLLLPVAALAADRHVYLSRNNCSVTTSTYCNTNADCPGQTCVTGNSQLNDCPNPAHNAKGTSNTDELQYCLGGGTTAGKIIGTAAGRITSGACTTDGGDGVGTVTPVTNAVSADVDGDGTLEVVYGHPQACVYDMAKSDACEVHAGTYSRPGAFCSANCTDARQVDTALHGICHDANCWFASILAWGFGPHLNGTGYGTAESPGYLRGAVMNGSTDSWDPNGDKNPADGSYPAIISGDADRDSTFDLTTCNATTCSGDIYHALIVGCGGGGDTPDWTWKANCSTDNPLNTAPDPDQLYQYVKLDSNADGTYDVDLDARTLEPVPVPNNRPRSVDHFIVKDIEFKRYNQGAGSIGQVPKLRTASINLNGDGQADGLKLDHIYFHNNRHGVMASVVTEHNQAAISDMWNRGCADYTEVKNSFLEQNNRLLFADEGTASEALGCSWSIHDNRILVNVLEYNENVVPAIGFFKSIDNHTVDGRPKRIRFYNNEVIYQQAALGHHHGQSFHFGQFGIGTPGGAGLGEFWMYGNIFRNRSDNVYTLDNFHPYSIELEDDCNGCSQSWRVFEFNNTYDGWSNTIPMDAWGRFSELDTGEIYVEKNNVMISTSEEENSVYTADATSVIYESNVFNDAKKCVGGGTRYFTCTGSDPLTHGGLAYYTPITGGGLDGHGSCDPDGMGNCSASTTTSCRVDGDCPGVETCVNYAGIDADGDGDQDTKWLDIAGHTVTCERTGSPIAIGAVQPVPPPPTCTEGIEECFD